jgi:tetrapyrrole methylase family protein/MazG family protein
MARPTVVVVGLGPGDVDLLSAASRAALESGAPVILRTGVHPAASTLGEVATFDHLYESCASFDEVYETIVRELAALAASHGTVVYAVPGSPLVAERTVELLRTIDAIDLEILPSLSFLDLAYGALGLDPLHAPLTVVDATTRPTRLRGPGPLLVAQCHSPAVLSDVKLAIDGDLLEPRPRAVILHHLGLRDEQILTVDLDDLDRFEAADHLTSVYVPELRTVGPAAEDLVDLMAALRERCPWDQKQTHGSLTRHLLEESYEALEALEALAGALDDDAVAPGELDAAYDHVAEELGDLVFQVVFHAHLAAEDGRFDLAQVLDGVRTKLIGRHPHVFGDVLAETADEVAANWEEIKKAEKGRSSVTDGIPAALPALTRYTKLLRKATAIDVLDDEVLPAERSMADLEAVLAVAASSTTDDATSAGVGDAAVLIGRLLSDVVSLARGLGVDPESALRHEADELTARIIAREAAEG